MKNMQNPTWQCTEAYKALRGNSNTVIMPVGERAQLGQACKQTHAAPSVLCAVANTAQERTVQGWESSRRLYGAYESKP